MSQLALKVADDEDAEDFFIGPTNEERVSIRRTVTKFTVTEETVEEFGQVRSNLTSAWPPVRPFGCNRANRPSPYTPSLRPAIRPNLSPAVRSIGPPSSSNRFQAHVQRITMAPHFPNSALFPPQVPFIQRPQRQIANGPAFNVPAVKCYAPRAIMLRVNPAPTITARPSPFTQQAEQRRTIISYGPVKPRTVDVSTQTEQSCPVGTTRQFVEQATMVSPGFRLRINNSSDFKF